MGKSVNQYFNERRYANNPYVGNKDFHPNTDSPQYPKRMWKPKRSQFEKTKDAEVEEAFRNGSLTDEQMNWLLTPESVRNQMAKKEEAEQEAKNRAKIGLELVNRHRYGDDIDILRATFTKSKEDLEKEKSLLIIASRQLIIKVMDSLQTIPKHEKFVLGSSIRDSVYTVLRHAIGIKKRFYRRNMLELIDVELEVLRELYYNACTVYPAWVDDKHLNRIYDAINDVGRIVGGLLKTTVC